MALTFTSWANYTDDDGNARTLSWTSAATIRGNLLRAHAEAIRQAIKERYQALELTVPPAHDAEFVFADVFHGTWFDSVQASITELIPLFANHLIGQFYGVNGWDTKSAIDMWTEESILTTNFTLDPRLPASPLPLSAWLFQQYKILNRLLWAYKARAGTRSKREGLGDPWYVAATNMNAASWVSGDWYGYEAEACTGEKVGSAFYVQGRSEVGLLAMPRARTIDIYGFIQKPTDIATAYGYPTPTFVGFGTNYENKLYRFSAGAAPTADAFSYLLQANTGGGNPGIGNAEGWATRGNFEIVEKFNVTGGFIFQ